MDNIPRAAHSGLRLAVAAALAGPPRKWRHGAVLMHKSKIISAGYNEQYKTNTSATRWFRWGFPHAEMSACIKAGFDACQGANLVVVRLTAAGSLGQSHPCKQCQKMFKDLGIKNVWYSNEDGNLVKM